MKYLFLFISLQSFAQNGALSNYVFTYGSECSGSTMTCYKQDVIFYSDYTFERLTMQIVCLIKEKGYYMINEGSIITYTDVNKTTINCHESYKAISSEDPKEQLIGLDLVRSYKTMNCENGLALEEIEDKSSANYYFIRKPFGGFYKDIITGERLTINEDFGFDKKNYSLSILYNSGNRKDWLDLKVMSIQKDNRTLTVQFPNDLQVYTLSWSEDQRGLICVNPGGKTQFFERTAGW